MQDNVSEGLPLDYHSSYEFPGNDSRSDFHTHPDSAHSNDFPICRLIVRQSHGRFLPHKQRLAVIDGYTQVQFGRDAAPHGASTPRIRLKDMEVSKLHATLFWDSQRHEWAVVDMGSKHGTFIGSGQDTKPTRLSATREASMPKRVKHLDRLSLGGTTFVVHIHEDRLPCVDCSASAEGDDDMIPLFSQQKSEDGGSVPAEQKRKRVTSDVPRNGNAKRALSSLKQSLLSRPGGVYPTRDMGGRTSREGDASTRCLRLL